MRKCLIFLSVLVLTISLSAQIRTGNIYGKVTDPDGNALPGATVTLTGPVTAPLTTVTSAEGTFRFLSLPPSKFYVLKAELTGFKTTTQGDIIVVLGGNTNINLTLAVGVIEEKVTVVAASPMVDVKKTSIGQNVSQEVLQSMPTARDPWVVLQMAPSILVDRENIGGTESGQQAGYNAKGSPLGGDNVWSVDGVVVTDPSAIGASPTYYDFDAFEEMNIITGGNDVTVQTGGISLNLVTRRGGNAPSIGGRVYMTDPKFQWENLTSALKKEGVRNTQFIRGIKDFGVNVGGPVLKDRLWLWGSYGVQDIKTINLYGVNDDTLLTNYVAKLNMQIVPQNKFEAFIHSGNKEKFGRDSSYEFPLGYHQKQTYYFGTPIFKIQDEHTFGNNLFVSLRFNYNGAGFTFVPMADEAMQKLNYQDVTTGIWPQSYWNYYTERPVYNYNAYVNYFNDTLFGLSHDIKFGVEYNSRGTDSSSQTPGNLILYKNFNYETLDPLGEGVPKIVPGIQLWQVSRGYYESKHVTSFSGFLSDTITKGRLTMLLGLRYDYQHPKLRPYSMKAVEKDHPLWKQYFPASVMNSIDGLIPALKIPAYENKNYSWKILSPRIGLTYDITGDSKTLVKLNLAQYGDFMGTGETWYLRPTGAGGAVQFYWMDDGNNVVDPSELYWYNPTTFAPVHAFDSSGNFIGDIDSMGGILWWDYDPHNPQKIGAPYYTIDTKYGSARTREAILTFEREILTDFSVAVDFSYRKYDKFRWELYYYPATDRAITSADYMVAGQIPSSIPTVDLGGAAGRNWYVWNETVTYSPNRLLTNRPDFNYDYKGLDIRINKRLSHRWMLYGSFTLQGQAQHFGTKGYLDPTNLWAENNKLWSPSAGAGSGKIAQLIFSKWLAKLEGLYQLPLDFNLGFTFTAREGHYTPHYMYINDPRLPPLSRGNVYVRLNPLGEGALPKLPTFYNLNMRLEKMIKIGDTGRVYLMADMFNVFNKATMDRRYDRREGTYNAQSGKLAPYASEYRANQILNPRVVRFGVRFQI